MKAVSAARLREQMALFRTKLGEFAAKHRADIRRDPAFRAQFHAMCANAGVDPLASTKARRGCCARCCWQAAAAAPPRTRLLPSSLLPPPSHHRHSSKPPI